MTILICAARRNITPGGFTSFVPTENTMVSKAQSQGVAGFVAQDLSEGATTFVEYLYVRNAGFPVAKVLNKAHYFAPTAGSNQINRIPGSTHQLDPGNLPHCNKPTVSPDGGSLVANNAPQLQACGLQGPAQCATGTGGARGSAANASGSAGGGGSSGTNRHNSATGSGTGTLADGTTPEGGAVTTIDPVTGQVISDRTSVGGPGSGAVTTVPVVIDPVDGRHQTALGVLAVVLLLGLVLVPPLVAQRMRHRAMPSGGPQP